MGTWYGIGIQGCVKQSMSYNVNSVFSLWAQAPDTVNVQMFFTYERQTIHIKQDNNIIIVSYKAIVSSEWHGQL